MEPGGGGAAVAPAFPGPGCSGDAQGSCMGLTLGAQALGDRPSDRPHLAPGPCWRQLRGVSREAFLGEALSEGASWARQAGTGMEPGGQCQPGALGR